MMVMIKKTNQEIGIESQEMIAVMLEEVIPEYHIVSNGTRGADLYITRNDGFYLEGEVKSAKELFVHSWHNKKDNTIVKHIRRGMFNILPEQLNHDFFVFVIRFVDIINEECIENGDFEVFYALGSDVREYLETQPLNCMNYKLNICNLPKVKVINGFLGVFNKVKEKGNQK